MKMTGLIYSQYINNGSQYNIQHIDNDSTCAFHIMVANFDLILKQVSLLKFMSFHIMRSLSLLTQKQSQ